MMKRPLLFLTMAMLIGSPSWAGRNANGMMLVHTDDSIVYTATDDYCQSATPDRCEDFVNTSHKTPDEATVVWLMAAFMGSSSPAVTTLQFGIHHNLPQNQGYIERYSACGPQPLELPDTGWPEPNDCGNLVAYGVPVYDHAFPFYWFAVWHDDDTYFFGTRTYPSTNEAKFVDDSSPPIEDLCFNFATMRWNVPGEMSCIPDQPHAGACCFPDGSCIYMPMSECQGFYMGDAVPCDPNPCPQPEPCCLPDGSCQMLMPDICVQIGGIPYGPGITCDPNPCVPIYGACCDDQGNCTWVTEEMCAGQGGSFLGDWTECYPDNPCPPAGACCLDMDGTCEMLTAAACAEQNGTYMGEGSTCEPVNPCFGFPTESTTWGRIKANFR
jgi:hypothetical protein